MKIEKYKKRIFEIIQIGNDHDKESRAFDWFITIVIVINLIATLMLTFDEMEKFSTILKYLELITVNIFTLEYILRIWTAQYIYPSEKIVKSKIKFFFSFYGIVDFLSFFPYYLPIFFPSGIVAFRMFRVIRFFRLFKINKKYDAFNVITNVLKDKKNQILSSVSMILILIIASSLLMYSLEHDAQPENFRNAFSGIWWSASTLLTVGYGDIYPVTFFGKLMAIVISFLGVGMVAIPTGIISAGFVEEYTKFKLQSREETKDYHFVTSYISENHFWDGKQVRDIVFPPMLILVMIIRDKKTIIPKGDTVLKHKDTLVIGARHYRGERDINLKEINIGPESPWVGEEIRNLDISQLDIIVMILRGNKTIVPNGSTTIKMGDRALMYSKRDNV